MKTATLNRSQAIAGKPYAKGDSLTVIKKGKTFTQVRLGTCDRSIYTADLEDFQTIVKTKS